MQVKTAGLCQQRCCESLRREYVALLISALLGCGRGEPAKPAFSPIAELPDSIINMIGGEAPIPHPEDSSFVIGDVYRSITHLYQSIGAPVRGISLYRADDTQEKARLRFANYVLGSRMASMARIAHMDSMPNVPGATEVDSWSHTQETADSIRILTFTYLRFPASDSRLPPAIVAVALLQMPRGATKAKK